MSEWEPGFRPSNGTMGDWFRSFTCGVCEHDHGWHDGEPADLMSCPILMHALIQPDGPPQWEGKWVGQFEQARCTNWKPCACAGPDDKGCTR